MAKIISGQGFDDDYVRDHLPDKGCIDLVVESEGRQYSVSFYNLVRLSHDLGYNGGKLFETGLILLEELNPNTIEQAINLAEAEGMFKQMKTCDEITEGFAKTS